MATSTSGSTNSSSGLGSAAARGVGAAATWGALAGVGASMTMAAYAMLAAATYQHSGFFTPLYHIASVFASPQTMMTSMQQAMTGDSFYFTLAPAAAGAVIHMMVGAVFGALFGIGAALLRLRGTILVAAALVWGVVVFAVSTWVGLPLAAAIFGSGDQIRNMTSMVGLGTFLIEHLLFGLMLGLLLLLEHRSHRH